MNCSKAGYLYGYQSAVSRFMLNHCAIFLLFFLREFFDHFFHRVVNKFFDKFVTQVYLLICFPNFNPYYCVILTRLDNVLLLSIVYLCCS